MNIKKIIAFIILLPIFIPLCIAFIPLVIIGWAMYQICWDDDDFDQSDYLLWYESEMKDERIK